MTTKKRRVIYLSDDEWDQAKRQAAPFLLTVSAYIRSLITGGRIIPAFVREEMDRIDAAPHPYQRISVGTVMAQAERDAVLNRVNRGKK